MESPMALEEAGSQEMWSVVLPLLGVRSLARVTHRALDGHHAQLMKEDSGSVVQRA